MSNAGATSISTTSLVVVPHKPGDVAKSGSDAASVEEVFVRRLEDARRQAVCEVTRAPNGANTRPIKGRAGGWKPRW
jgi:hypothetical protein